MSGRDFIDEVYKMAEDEGLEVVAGVFEGEGQPIVVCRTGIKFDHALVVVNEIIKCVVLALLEGGNDVEALRGAWLHTISRGIDDVHREWKESRGN
jgi:uridine phosphorylase